MYNSQLNLWIRVASLNKGRWRHKMGVLLGKVRRKCTHAWWASVVTAPWLTHSWNSPVGASNDLLLPAWLRSLRGETTTESTCLAVTHWAHSFCLFFFSFLATVGYLSKICRGLTTCALTMEQSGNVPAPPPIFRRSHFKAIKICIVSHDRPFAVSCPVDPSRSAVKERILSREQVREKSLYLFWVWRISFVAPRFVLEWWQLLSHILRTVSEWECFNREGITSTFIKNMSCLVHIEKNIQPPFTAVPKK